VRRLLPWVLFGLLGMATGLGIGLGLAYAPTNVAAHGPWSRSAFVATSKTSGVTIIGDRAACPNPPQSGPGPEVPLLPAGSHHAISYLYARCNFSPLKRGISEPNVESVTVKGSRVLLVTEPGRAFASWRHDGYYFSSSSIGVPKDQVLRFIAGLRAS
jgi:hypothetical protein